VQLRVGKVEREGVVLAAFVKREAMLSAHRRAHARNQNAAVRVGFRRSAVACRRRAAPRIRKYAAAEGR